MYLRYYWTFI